MVLDGGQQRFDSNISNITEHRGNSHDRYRSVENESAEMSKHKNVIDASKLRESQNLFSASKNNWMKNPVA